MRSVVEIGLIGLLGVILLAPSVGAVDLTGGKKVKLLDKDGTSSDMARVRFVKDAAIAAPLPDPTSNVSQVRIHSEDGDTGWLPLTMSLWEAAGTTGYKYRDTTGGAVEKVILKTKNGLGKLILKLKGDAYGAVALAGPETFVEVELEIGATQYCGRFEPPTSEERKNEVGKVILKGPSIACVPPNPTPTATQTETPTATPTDPPAAARIVFTTSTISTGNLGGVTGADALCASEASGAGLPGTYLAWIADSDPSSAPAVRFNQAAPLGFVRTDGAVVADNWADLTDGSIQNPLNISAGGTPVPFANESPEVATNVAVDGTQLFTTNHCGDWNSTIGTTYYGNGDSTSSNWTEYPIEWTTRDCQYAWYQVYCFQQ